MKDLEKAIIEEKAYVVDRMNGIDTSLPERLQKFGYDTLDKYFKDKREYLFNLWEPEVYYVDVRTLTVELEKAVQNEAYGIYISTSEGLYAFHGSDEIDYELCESLGVCVAEVFHKGGTIIGDQEDFGIEIVAPRELGLNHRYFLDKFREILSQYEDDVIISGNDILVDGKKVVGSMTRNIGGAFIWAAQVSWGDHKDIINKICRKKSEKVPGRMDKNKIKKDKFEKEVLKWLQKH